MILPGDEIHYVALLDSEAKTLQIIPMTEPLEIPLGTDPRIDARVSLNITLIQEAKHGASRH